ncbi:hypothetical protein CRYUN_Cryun17cG0053100 [Craigia yunnanensis]
MARAQFIVLGGSGPGEEVGLLIHSSAGLLLLSMFIFSLSIISMVIFACGENNSEKPSTRPGDTPVGGVCGSVCGVGCGGGGGR